MKLPAIKLSKPHFPQSVKGRVTLVAAAIVVLAGSVYAATPLPTGSIEVRTYDVTGGIKEPLGNVEVQVNSVSAPYECNDPIKTTPPESAGPNHGYVKYVNCESAVYSKPNRKYLKYTIIKATRDGYQVSQKSKFKVGANKASSRGGSFAVRKDRTTKVEISLEREGTPQQARVAPTPPTSGEGVNKGNIVFSQTRHVSRYGLSNPDPAWISNQPNSYFLGSVLVGWSVDLVRLNSPSPDSQYGTESANGYMFGLIRRPDGTKVGCGWLEPGTVSTNTLKAYSNECSNHPFLSYVEADSPAANSIRKSFGTQFNCDHDGTAACNGPITLFPQDMNPACTDAKLYKNYFSGNDYTQGSFSDPVGTIDLTLPDAIRYRFTTLDGKAAAVVGDREDDRSAYGWGFINRDCIVGWPTNDAIYGRHPNSRP